MSDGGKTVFINTQERAVSVDLNRLQKFANADRAELFRYMLDVVGVSDDVDAGAIITEPSTIETPLRAEIFNGLMVQPQIASLNVLVTPGLLYAMAPDAAADDSNYKFIHDAGVTTLGSLTMTANSSGSTRIDVIECQVQYTNVETDNRDIFNPVSGLFTATSVTKAKQGSLVYRIRLGTPGAGYPGAVSGWLPLAVASVPTATTTNDTIVFWDVRPLLNDREFHVFNLPRLTSYERRAMGKNVFDHVSASTFSGLFERTLGSRRVGGQIHPGGTAVDAPSIVLSSALNQAAGQVPGASTFWYLYLVCPYGLPRWSRYTDASLGVRKPRSPRGIPLVSNVAPNINGFATSGIAMPASTGLVTASAASEAVCIAVGRTDGVGDFVGLSCDGRVQLSEVTLSVVGTALSNGSATFALTDGTHYPSHAKAIWAFVTFLDSAGGIPAGSGELYKPTLVLYDDSGQTTAKVDLGQYEFGNPTASAITGTFTTPLMRIPIIGDYPSTTPGTRNVLLSYSGGTGTPQSATLFIRGWELGP